MNEQIETENQSKNNGYGCSLRKFLRRRERLVFQSQEMTGLDEKKSNVAAGKFFFTFSKGVSFCDNKNIQKHAVVVLCATNGFSRPYARQVAAESFGAKREEVQDANS